MRSSSEAIRSPGLTILYRDEFFIAVDKPPGMVVHRGPQTVDVEPVLLQTLRDQIDRLVYPVHRLDQPTSGVILFGLTPAAAAAMVDQFTRRQVAKYYQALVRGWMHRDGSLRIPLRSASTAPTPASSNLDGAMQKAETGFTTIRWYELPGDVEQSLSGRISLVEAQPKTGRWHQIRRHLKHIAHPVIGDYRHGDERYNRWFERDFGAKRLLLAACCMEFCHPFTGRSISIRSGRGENFDKLVARLTAFEVPIRSDGIPPQPQSQRIDRGSLDDRP